VTGDARRRPDTAGTAVETARTLDFGRATRALLPRTAWRRALAVSLSTDRDRYPPGVPVRLRLTVRNRLPVPLCLPTTAPVPWTWAVDGVDRASRTTALPDESGTLRLGRRETRTVEWTWHRRIRVASDRWRVAEEGPHTLEARVCLPTPVADERTVRIE
jgi:hypothetical protein